MKKFNLFLLIIIVITIFLIAYLSFFNNSNYKCSKDFRIITRNEWKANPPIDSTKIYSYKQDLKDVIKYIVIHHSAFWGNIDVKEIQSYQQGNGYNDIAYHYFITKDGKIYEGRNINLLGAHAGETVEANNLADSIRNHLIAKNIIEAYKLDPDYGSIGICLEGNFEEEKPTDCQINSLKKLIIYLMKKYNIDNNNVILHSEVRNRLILNKKLKSVNTETICPGKYGIVVIKKMLNQLYK